MSYTVLARKYRPQSFAELVGQDHVATIIGNAIDQDRVAHAFLFTGVRGVGKTTTARILAKSLNCEKGPSVTPCGGCGPCLDITSGRDVDVQEIDGASNNGVDDVRRLQESLPFRPARDRYKIVIVDEVHMLSTGAFNAFLKTLEEPPPHVKFIFATTEIQKVPVTIRSRCQRYDFRLIPRTVVASRVREILAHEGIEADDGTVSLVAREAAGSMRDALTLLDQLVAFGGTKLEVGSVARVLGVAAREHVRALTDALVRGEPATIVARLHASDAQGADPLHLAKQVLELVRDLAVASVTADEGQLVDWVSEERTQAEELLRNVSPLELQRLFAMTTKVVDEVGRSSTPATSLEMGLLRVATRPRLSSVEDLVARIEALELRLARSDGGNRGGPTGTSGRGGASGGTGEFPRSSGGGMRSESPNAEAFVPPPDDARPARNSAAPASAPRAPVGEPEARIVRTREEGPRAPASATDSASLPAVAPAHPAQESVAPERPSLAPSLKRATLHEWTSVVERLRADHPPIAAVVEQAEARVVTRERIVLGFVEGSFFGRQASQPDSLAAIAAAARAALGGDPRIEVKLDTPAGEKGRTLADVVRDKSRAELESKRREVLAHPAVVDALDLFPDARGRETVHFENDPREQE